MRERPIIFSPPMVRALLAGTKTQMRRVVKPRPMPAGGWAVAARPRGFELVHWDNDEQEWRAIACPYGQPGDRLWVRETWGHFERSPKPGDRIYYRADGECVALEPWRPSIHMPRWASRITLEITDVRVERLQDISAQDCVAEGVRTTMREHDAVMDLRDQYGDLWESINGPGSWDANPWVWVVEFKRTPEARDAV